MSRSPNRIAEATTIDATERLQRVLSARGIESRRKAETLIRAGRVTVDGATVTELGTKVDPRRARITVDGQVLRPQRLRYILLNKPTGYITTTDDERGRRTVMDLVNVPERVYPVGRLDRDTEGLLLLTNDGDVANRVMHPRYGLAKEYNVLTDRRPIDPVMERVRRGATIDGRTLVPEEFRILRETRDGLLLTITIHEGTKHVVRRIMEQAGIRVVRLRRVRIGPLSLAGIREGTYRELTPGELTSLFEALRIHGPEERPIAPTGVKIGPPVRLRDAPGTTASRLAARPRHAAPEPTSRHSQPAAKVPSRGGDTAPNSPRDRRQPTGAGPAQENARRGRRDDARGNAPADQRPRPKPAKSNGDQEQAIGRVPGKRDAQEKATKPPAPPKGTPRGRGRKLDASKAPASKKTSRHRSKSAPPRRPAPPPKPPRTDDDRP